MKLHLGVLDVPYANGSKTTGDIAEILEQKYGVMEYFASQKADDIAKALETDMIDLLDSLINGVAINSNPFAELSGKTEALLKKALADKFMDGSNFSGRPVPTMASLGGISKRFKDKRNSKKRRGVRPSFVDTGLYRQSFKAWVEL